MELFKRKYKLFVNRLRKKNINLNRIVKVQRLKNNFCANSTLYIC